MPVYHKQAQLYNDFKLLATRLLRWVGQGLVKIKGKRLKQKSKSDNSVCRKGRFIVDAGVGPR